MTRVLVVAVATLVLVACGGGDDTTGDVLLADGDGVEGLVDAPLARLEVTQDLDTIPDGACVTAVTVAPGGATATGPRWLVTFDLAATPADAAALGVVLGEAACADVLDTELARIVGALGAVGPDTVDATFLDPDGRRWIPGTAVTGSTEQ